jgi:hypothetical protein
MLTSGQTDRAIAAFDQAIANGGEEPTTYLGRGRAFLSKGEPTRRSPISSTP